jgi:glycosyltransferase involved in cell wall biosynthesis
VKGVSIILCCYNSAERLPETLKHLAAQKTGNELPWEVIVVNNNSQDNTVEVAKKEWSKYATTSSFKIVDQPIPGLSFARKKGIETAKYDYLLFCDDDNWLSENYVQNAFDIMETDKRIGALGGWCEPVFETEEPEWFKTFAGNFAVGKTVPKTGLINEPNGYLYGAGLVIRKSAMGHLYASGFKNILSDRKGKKLSSGGDIELVYALKLAGYAIYFDERLFFKHVMPGARLTFNYLKKIRKSMYYSNFILGMYVDQLKGVPNDLKYLVKRHIKSIIKEMPAIARNYLNAGEYDKPFILNQIYTRLYFILYPLKYHKIRKYLSELQNKAKAFN